MQDGGSNTSFDVVWCHYVQKCYHLVEQARGYAINAYLFRSVVKKQNHKGGSYDTQLYYAGGMSNCTSKEDAYRYADIE